MMAKRILDLNANGKPMGLDEARRFIRTNSDDAGRWPAGPGQAPQWTAEKRARWDQAWVVVAQHVRVVAGTSCELVSQ